MTATQTLQQQHRNIAQKLALLRAEGDLGGPAFESVVAELAAHLAAEMNVFYPAAEEALGEPCSEQRRHNEWVRRAIFRAAGLAGDARTFPRALHELAEVFEAHVRAEERAVHPSLECIMGVAQLDALGKQVIAFRAAPAP